MNLIILRKMCFVLLLFTIQTNSQIHLKSNNKERTIFDYKLNSIFNAELSTNGSPFNINDNPQIDSVLLKMRYTSDVKFAYTYDSLGNVYTEEKVNNWRHLKTYTDEGKILQDKFDYWKDGKWTNGYITDYYYDSLCNDTLILMVEWDDSTWINHYRARSFYNQNHTLDYFITESWELGEWARPFRVSYTYYPNNMIRTILSQNWENNSWDGYSWRETFTYDSLDNQSTILVEEYIDKKWINYSIWRYEYNEINKKILTLLDYWIENKWINGHRNKYSYDENSNLVLTTTEISDSGEWKNDSRKITRYNDKGHLESGNCESWDNILQVWQPDNGSIYLYDNDSNKRSYYSEELKIYYTNPTNVENNNINSSEYFLYQNYPNPFNPTTTIKYIVKDKYSNARLSIFNILGQEVVVLVDEQKKIGTYEMKFNAKYLVSGTYFYYFKNGNINEIRKMVLIK